MKNILLAILSVIGAIILAVLILLIVDIEFYSLFTNLPTLLNPPSEEVLKDTAFRCATDSTILFMIFIIVNYFFQKDSSK